MKNFLIIVLKNAVNAILTNAALMAMLPKVFQFHDHNGLINIGKAVLAAVGAREAMVWGPWLLKWSKTNADPPNGGPPGIPGKLAILFILLFLLPLSARAQNTCNGLPTLPCISLQLGANTIQLGATPSTTTATFQLNFPSGAASFMVVGQPHTNTNLSFGVSVSLNQSNNTNLTPTNLLPPVAGSFGLVCYVGGAGLGLPVATSMASVQPLIVAAQNQAGTAACTIPASYSLVMGIVGGGNTGATYDLFVIVNSSPVQTAYCLPSVGAPTCYNNLIAGKDGNGNLQPISVNTNGVITQGTQSTDCNKTLFISALGATTTQIVPAVASQKIWVCFASGSNNSATAMNITFVEGTGANCATGQTQLSGKFLLNANTLSGDELTLPFTATSPMVTNVAADALCVTGSAAGSTDVTVIFAQHP